jgi:hypothetical protein
MKHTKGPWHYLPLSGEITALDDRYIVADVGNNQSQERMANAHIIAAAPELLESIKELVQCLGNWVEIADKEDWRDYDGEAISRAEKLIARIA